MRLLTIALQYPPAPVHCVGRYVFELNRALGGRAAVEPHVLRCGGDAGSARSEEAGVTVHNADCAIPARALDWVGNVLLKNVPLAAKACELAREYGPFDLICAHDWPGAVAARAVSCAFGVPMVFFIHHTEVARRGNQLTRAQLYVAELEAWIAERARAVVVPSSSVSEEVQSTYNVPRRRITVIPCGVATDTFTMDDDISDFRAILADPDEAVVLYVGRLSPTKGADTLVEAMRVVGEQHPEAKLVVVGDGVLREELAKQAEELGVATLFTGHLEGKALAAAYRCADVVVVPGRYEPTGMVALEAMACGKPVVASDVGGLREVIADGSGLRVPPSEPQPLAEAILRVLDDPPLAQTLGAAAQKQAGTYTWESSAERLVSLASRLLRSDRKGEGSTTSTSPERNDPRPEARDGQRQKGKERREDAQDR